MSRYLESEPTLEVCTTPYQVARSAWHYALTNDAACRDICDRDSYIAARVRESFPQVHEIEIAFISKLALDSVIYDFHI